MTKKKRVLIFDYDGTIVDSTKEVFLGFNEIAGKYGLKKLKSKKELGKLYEDNVFQGLLDYGLKKKELIPFFNEWRIPYLRNFMKIRAFKGMKQVIKKLKKNNFVFIITSNSTDAVKKSMNHLRIHIDNIFGGDREKSKVVKINKIKKRYKNCEIFYIGDTKGDVIEAEKAGVKSVAVTWGLHSKKVLKRAEPDIIINKPRQLLQLF